MPGVAARRETDVAPPGLRLRTQARIAGNEETKGEGGAVDVWSETRDRGERCWTGDLKGPVRKEARLRSSVQRQLRGGAEPSCVHVQIDGRLEQGLRCQPSFGDRMSRKAAQRKRDLHRGSENRVRP